MHNIALPINRDGVKNFLPHREPFLFIDRVIKLTETTILAESVLEPDMDVFKGHFPDLPIMPGVLLIETVAQAGALIIAMNNTAQSGSFTAFSGVESAKFRRPVYPGATLRVNAEILRSRGGFYKFEGSATVNDDVVVELKFAASQMTL